ncbi:MAG: peptidylprolyl isomerase [Alistipes putredinis]
MDGSAISGGELDPQPLDGFVRQFADALADLKPGQVSEVVETQYGYHLIQLIDQKGRMYHARHIVLRPSYTLEELAAPARMLDSIANLIRKDSITFEEAARKFSDDDNSKMNGGVVTKPRFAGTYSKVGSKLYRNTLHERRFRPGRWQEPRRLQCPAQS